MARDYAKIFTAIWQSRKFRKIKNNDRARLLYMYLHSCPQVNSVGCFTLPIGYVVTDLGWSESDAALILRDLAGAELIEWDEGEEMIRIIGFIEHDPPTNEKHAAAVKAVARSLHDGPLKVSVLKDLLACKHCACDDGLSAMLDTLSGQVGKPLVLTLTTSVPNPVPSPLPHHPVPAGKPADDADDGFEEFFTVCPKRENRMDAIDAYRVARTVASREDILAGAKRYAAACAGRAPGHISPPSKWLAKERWTDGSAAPPDPDGAETDPSWGNLAEKVVGEIGRGNFQAYFADALVVDGDPQRIQIKSATKKRLIDQKFSRQLRKVFGDVVVEVAP